MEPKAPFNFWIMDVNNYIFLNGLKEVKTQLIYEPSTSNFHPEGLYSEEIFGQIGSPQRVATLGYIDLHTK